MAHGLNSSQLSAVQATKGAVLVLAISLDKLLKRQGVH